VPRPGTARDSVRGDPGDGHARERLAIFGRELLNVCVKF
jgi:hypothetical protein